jgi:AraC-like DNA-binding protein
MILLDQLLEGLDVGVAPFAICEVRKAASLLMEDGENASLHYVLAGEGVAQTMTGHRFALSPHTVMIAPPGTCMVVSSGEDRGLNLPAPRCEPLPGGWQRMVVGDGGPGIVLACGAVHATHQETTGLFDYLRAPLVDHVADDAAFRDPFHRLLDELAAPRPGTRTLAEMLLMQCLIALLRRHSESGECRVPWLAALDQPQLSSAVTAMLDRPAEAHSLESLARIAGMSRAVFAERFREAFDRTPMEFLKEVRLRRAARLLTTTDLPIKTITARVGFASRSYFSRAFKAFAGHDPARYRAHAAAPAEAIEDCSPAPVV